MDKHLEYSFNYQLMPRHSDIDKFGVIHHSKYFYWLEEARYYLFYQLPTVMYKEIEKYDFPVTKLESKYIKSISKIEPINIKVTIQIDFDIPILRFYYRITDLSHNKLFTKAYTEHVLLDSKKSIMSVYPDDMKKVWEFLMKAGGSDE